MQELKSIIRDIPDFPKKGIIFRDITPLLQRPETFSMAIDKIADNYKNTEIDLVLGAEARGFILGGALAYKLGAGFVPARKPGKLPYAVTKSIYNLEYGNDALEIHEDAIHKNHRVLIVDDVLATGGTAGAKVELTQKSGGIVVGIAFLIELVFLGGREKLADFDIFSLIKY
ncbi:MAG TPA: adenine phosphoribosyltransferase [Actinobacteria bacterium]|nr:adenine phosphoribosyltransferase [Actinomycetes bacterium]HEX21768.1 adenine phosphoribosyltransferase [Actinomycetota bacterium]